MQNDSFETPRRRTQLNDNISDRRSKLATIESSLSRESQVSRGILEPNIVCEHWNHHEKARQNRLSSLFKIRKSKLEEITGQNHKIFVRINQQQSHYPTLASPQKSDKATIKFNCNQENMLGPIGNWQPPSHFVSGIRGIMCEKNFAGESMVLRNQRKNRPSLPRLKTPEKENFHDFYTPQTMKSQNVTPVRRKELSDLYMMM